MELVVKITDDMWKAVQDGWVGNELWHNAIANGTPLPEHHGRLIDADAIPRHLVRDIDEIDKQPTIIDGSDSK